MHYTWNEGRVGRLSEEVAATTLSYKRIRFKFFIKGMHVYILNDMEVHLCFFSIELFYNSILSRYVQYIQFLL